jgi:GNAT superfamily N-acetyltransferase
MELKILDNPNEEDINQVKAGLKAFNDRIVGDDHHQALSFVIKDERDEVVGGIIGGTYWGWLHIDRFWIKDEFRRQGLGTQLLALCENEARRRGCRHTHLDTHDFQALPFYLAHGYRMKAEFKDLPPGHSKFVLYKDLE